MTTKSQGKPLPKQPNQPTPQTYKKPHHKTQANKTATNRRNKKTKHKTTGTHTTNQANPQTNLKQLFLVVE